MPDGRKTKRLRRTRSGALMERQQQRRPREKSPAAKAVDCGQATKGTPHTCRQKAPQSGVLRLRAAVAGETASRAAWRRPWRMEEQGNGGAGAAEAEPEAQPEPEAESEAQTGSRDTNSSSDNDRAEPTAEIGDCPPELTKDGAERQRSASCQISSTLPLLPRRA
ncbi:hypothetical protein AAES_48548 [Amazona aestiva]|uniref:Uncharacterized protein n=1 Tax=Amazona aestiva TaxID=12930 RepID=A0A0Q3MQ34_AMAAE|nr:hypothetical protein AAES_48548 [Amazona aestiva]